MSSQSQHERNLDDGLDEDAFAMDAHTAASIGDVQQLQTAIEAGGEGPDRRNQSGWTALMYAAHYDHAGVISFLASIGADGTAACGLQGRGRAAIMMAAMCGNDEALRALIRHFGGMGSDLIEARDVDSGGGMTALGYASVNGHAGAATILLEAGARTDVIEDARGYTPLMLASLEGHEVVAQWLLHHGADPSYANILGETARSVAARVGHQNIVNLLDRNGSVPSPSIAAQGILEGPARLAEKLAKQQRKKTTHLCHCDPVEFPPDIESFLVQAGVEKYHQSFLDHNINLERLLEMGDEDLKGIGIVLLGPRRKLTSAIAKYKQKQLATFEDTSPPTPSQACWDEAYAKELENFESHGDEGEVWFGEDALYRVLRWLDSHFDREFESEKGPSSAPSILDLGCGNGVTCAHLIASGYVDVAGVDYSEAAIALAKKVAEKHKSDFKLEVGDILNPSKCALLQRKYDVCIDKGTYDAISLDPAGAGPKRKKFVETVRNLLEENGLFIITSCNWTEDELKCHFGGSFTVKEVLPTPKFTFGGVEGNMVTSIVFQKSS